MKRVFPVPAREEKGGIPSNRWRFQIDGYWDAWEGLDEEAVYARVHSLFGDHVKLSSISVDQIGPLSPDELDDGYTQAD